MSYHIFLYLTGRIKNPKNTSDNSEGAKGSCSRDGGSRDSYGPGQLANLIVYYPISLYGWTCVVRYTFVHHILATITIHHQKSHCYASTSTTQPLSSAGKVKLCEFYGKFTLKFFFKNWLCILRYLSAIPLSVFLFHFCLWYWYLKFRKKSLSNLKNVTMWSGS